jgi:hypothetical protein
LAHWRETASDAGLQHGIRRPACCPGHAEIIVHCWPHQPTHSVPVDAPRRCRARSRSGCTLAIVARPAHRPRTVMLVHHIGWRRAPCARSAARPARRYRGFISALSACHSAPTPRAALCTTQRGHNAKNLLAIATPRIGSCSRFARDDGPRPLRVYLGE